MTEPKSYLSRLAREIVPYTPGEQPKDNVHLKINTNENPYPPSLATLAAVREVTAEELGLYADPEMTQLRQVIAEQESKSLEDACTGFGLENIFVSHGSDDVLAAAIQALLESNNASSSTPGEQAAMPVLFPDITYNFYTVWADLYRVPYRQIPLDENFQVCIEDYLIPNGGIILANPNAPTGDYRPLSEIERLVAYNLERAVVIVDEAYIMFGGESAVRLIPRYPNLLVVRTMSKAHALAGLRVGYALGHPALIDGLNRIKNSTNPYALDLPAQKAAIAAMRDRVYYEENAARIAKTRDRLASELKDLGFRVLPSLTNFLFIAHPTLSGADLSAALRSEGIIVRHFSQARIDNFLRVSIGTDKDMALFVEKIKLIVRPS